MNIGERLKYIRETYDVSQVKIAKYLGVSKYSICHYEKNDRDIPLRNLIMFANYFDFSIDYILGFTNSKKYYDLKKCDIDLKITSERIINICEERNWSNVKMANELNTCESSIRNYKKGNNIILLSFAIELHNKYNYSIDWLVGRTDTRYTPNDSRKAIKI